MSRRQRDSVTLSLFPFLSVLACCMGVMIVIISGQNLLAIGDTANQYLEISGGNQEREAIYVECQEKGIIIHPEKTEVSLEALKLDDGTTSFHQLLHDAAMRKRGGSKTVVLLIRPDGIDCYERCVTLAYKHQISWGKDALLRGGQVILTEDGKPLVQLQKGEQ